MRDIEIREIIAANIKLGLSWNTWIKIKKDIWRNIENTIDIPIKVVLVNEWYYRIDNVELTKKEGTSILE